jgi:hypothetical protein
MSSEVHVRLYEELNVFLPPENRKRRFAYKLNGSITIKKLLAELHLPGAHVDLVLINGKSAGFSNMLKPGDFVSIYPVFESFDIGALVGLRKKPLRRTRFLMGPGLVWLASYLRRTGFDTVDAGLWPLKKIVRVAQKEKRIVLTKNSVLMAVPDLSRIYMVRERNPKRQLAEVLSRFDLYGSARFSQLRRIIGRVPPLSAESA